MLKLSARCVITNEPMGQEDELLTAELMWAPNFRLALSHASCNVEYFVCHRIRRKRFIKNAIYQCVITALFAAVMWQFASGFIIIPLIILQGFRILSPNMCPLRVSKKQGEGFWLDGCGPEFLQACAAEYGCVW